MKVSTADPPHSWGLCSWKIPRWPKPQCTKWRPHRKNRMRGTNSKIYRLFFLNYSRKNDIVHDDDDDDDDDDHDGRWRLLRWRRHPWLRVVRVIKLCEERRWSLSALPCVACSCRPLFKVPWQRPSRTWISNTSPWRITKPLKIWTSLYLSQVFSFTLLNFILFPPHFKTNNYFRLEKKKITNSFCLLFPSLVHSLFLPFSLLPNWTNLPHHLINLFLTLKAFTNIL